MKSEDLKSEGFVIKLTILTCFAFLKKEYKIIYK